jgi:hypothetical protein
MFTEEEARCKYLQKGQTNCWAVFVVWQCTVHDQFCSRRSWETRVNGEPGNYVQACFFSESCSHIGTACSSSASDYRFSPEKEKDESGNMQAQCQYPRIRSSCSRILTPPAEFDTSRRNHWRCLRRLSSTHLCWSCFGAGCRWNVLFLSTVLQQQSVVQCRIWH